MGAALRVMFTFAGVGLFSPLLFWGPARRPGTPAVSLQWQAVPRLNRQQGKVEIGYGGQPGPVSGRQGREHHDYLREENLVFLRSF